MDRLTCGQPGDPQPFPQVITRREDLTRSYLGFRILAFFALAVLGVGRVVDRQLSYPALSARSSTCFVIDASA